MIAVIILFLDQLTKFLILNILPVGKSIPIIKGIFHLSLVYNTGIAFGLFKGAAFFFIVIAILVAAILIFILRLGESDSNNLKLRIPLAFILGGAVGNFIDRLNFGFVVDFLDFRIWPVFNIADSAITIGGVILFFILLRQNAFSCKAGKTIL